MSPELAKLTRRTVLALELWTINVLTVPKRRDRPRLPATDVRNERRSPLAAFSRLRPMRRIP
jgi:hypothetical protein